VDCDFAAGAEAEVGSVVTADECRVVSICADAAAGQGVGVGIDGYREDGQKRKNDGVSHLEEYEVPKRMEDGRPQVKE